ncbi:MAG: aminomethyl-transferring glycine dehydrogenase subunit GcvPA [Candidatus Bathyarchaeia archaeon]
MNWGRHLIPNSSPEAKASMLKYLGMESIEELFKDIPEGIRVEGLDLPSGMSELEVMGRVGEILKKNSSLQDMPIFLGGGAWFHYVPAVVDEVVRRSEFLTAYTPYQPEASQGMLQALFEYQSLICDLTEMDFANCSLYDFSSALGEAARMAKRVTGRGKFLVPKFMNPQAMEALASYAEPAGIEVLGIERDPITGQIDLEDLKAKATREVAGVFIENPAYLGFFEEEAEAIGEIAKEGGALFIVGFDPISLGIVKPPGALGADIAIGEGQPLGNYVNFGGPNLGIFACNGLNLLRQMPGRIIGMTSTREGERAFCMALQAREQHIRREGATSNICTNEALCALAAAVYLSLLGPEGLRGLCETILVRSKYCAKLLGDIEGVKAPLFEASHFKEFVVNFDRTGMRLERIHEGLLGKGIHGGRPLREFPELGESALYCVTEMHSKGDVERLAKSLAEVVGGG